MTRRLARRLLLVAIALLYAISIPWYREAGETTGLVWGLPTWVSVALGCYVAIAFLNCAAWLLADVTDADADVGEGEDP